LAAAGQTIIDGQWPASNLNFAVEMRIANLAFVPTRRFAGRGAIRRRQQGAAGKQPMARRSSAHAAPQKARVNRFVP
jgi:hypothetical protein